MFYVPKTKLQLSPKFQLQCPAQQFTPGQVVAVLGTNGAGKSSLLSCWADGGTKAAPISWHGQNFSKLSRQQQAQERSYLMQQQSFHFPIRSQDLVQMGAAPWAQAGQDDTSLVLQTMNSFACLEFKNVPYAKLSVGQQQRVQLSRIFLQVQQAKFGGLIFLDEPTSAQDLAHQHQILQTISHHAKTKQALIFISMHDLNHALKYADQCLVLSQGKWLSSGTPLTVLTPEFVRQHWQIEPEVFVEANKRYMF